MSRPRFSEMLVERRRQLGLSVAQAARALRLKEHNLIAFEEGDFANLPKSGYAQAQLGSYARYLGLNARAVVRQFTNDLYEWERGEAGVRPGGASAPSEPYVSGNMSGYRGARGLLPTSGGYAGDLGEFATTSPARSRQHQSIPLVRQQRQGGEAARSRRYTSREFVPESAAQRGSSRQAPPRRGGFQLDREERVTTRRVRPGEYTDDLRYGDALTYEAASTRSGRRSSRNIARIDRPNVQRRRPGRNEGGTGQQSSRSAGTVGAVGAFVSNERRLVLGIVLAVALALTFIIIMSVGSCMRGQGSTERTVPVSSATTTTSATSADPAANNDESSSDGLALNAKGTDDAASSAGGGTSTKNGESTTKAVTATIVKVSVDDGANTWIEVVNDGTSEVAKTVTGPWSGEYTVTKSITISAAVPTAVTVSKNGKIQSFGSKTSGLGTITIEGTDVPASTGEDAEAGEDEDDTTLPTTSGADATPASASGTSTTAAKSSQKSSNTNR